MTSHHGKHLPNQWLEKDAAKRRRLSATLVGVDTKMYPLIIMGKPSGGLAFNIPIKQKSPPGPRGMFGHGRESLKA
ncbi:MAG: hypothetical protein NPIRA03_22880 [Nitrospirales bacterium]|nr:MAG: hypothetical protein NPIRA03_22880 [Nitrospirales bacterium]